MKSILAVVVLLVFSIPQAFAGYERNKAVPVDKVLFGEVVSVRNITETELREDRSHGWKVFGGALVGGALGNQFGSGNGRAITTILGAVLGGSVVNGHSDRVHEITSQLVELVISIDNDGEYLVIQDLDPSMIFHSQDKIRMIYLSSGSVRIDKQF